jgi:predicted SnoaL-like aldol condensation-catalyzing enzyme
MTLHLSRVPNAATPSSRQERNKQVVLAFYESAVNGADPVGAAAFLGARYVQHNPSIADGVDGFMAFAHQLRQRFPNVRARIKRVFADGDFVILHVHAQREPEDNGLAIVDIFRLEDGRIVEHWDVRQPVPPTAANRNGMF